jgi:hypothetical protein
MVTSKTAAASPGFLPASLPTTADELIDKLLLLQRVGEKEFETRHGLSKATMTLVFEVDDGGVTTALGERAIFWQLVRRQLEKATAEQPYIGGRLVLAGQAYRLDPPSESEIGLLAKALEQLPTD